MGLKKAFLFSVDAIIASIILVSSMLIFSNLYIEENKTMHLNDISNDMLNILSEMKISEINNSYVKALISQGEITNLNNTIIEQIGEFWALNKTEICQNLVKNITMGIFPSNIGFSILIGNEEVFGTNSSFNSQHNLIATRKMISGYEKSKPIKGSTSRAYLKSISGKKDYAYAYFGGFVGQGELFRQLDYMPSDADIISAFLEVDADSSFEIWINNQYCVDLTANSNENMTSESFNISDCIGLFSEGAINNISVKFSGDLEKAYFAGGIMKVKYATTNLSKSYNNSYMQYYFPGVNGVSNLYSSFYVPGDLRAMNIYLHFESEYPTYLTIGDRTVFQNNGSAVAEQTIYIDNLTLSSFPILLNYAELGQTTVPIRFASYNNTIQTILDGGNADIILITDLSGSMKSPMDSWQGEGFEVPDCDSDKLYKPGARRLAVAACLDKEFNSIVMNDSFLGNRLWLVDFSDDANPFFSNDLSDLTMEKIDEEIDSRYKSKKPKEIQGGTCLCCAINMAYDILEEYSGSNRTKSVLVMTDGIPTYCCGRNAGGGCNETSTGTTSEWLPGGCIGDEDDCSGSDCSGPINNAINSAKRLYDEMNATVHAVGIGPIDNCENANYTLRRIAEDGNGTFFLGQNTSELMEFYEETAYSILDSINQTSQLLEVKGNVTLSKIYPDSYIEMYYDSQIEEPEFGEIVMNFESDKFDNCTDYVEIPSKVRILEAKVISFSGEHWTKNVTVNNNEVFLLENYNSNFYRLGDPFVIYVPPNNLTGGINSISISTGDEPINDTGCSLNNSLIYLGAVKFSTSYSDVWPLADGCTWEVETEDSGTIIMSVPPSYSGSSLCYYNSTSIKYNSQDSIDHAVENLLSNIDFDDDGKIDINIDELDMQIDALWISQVPYLWGPAVIEVRAWQ